MAHGYTNRTHAVADVVVKRYDGPDAAARQHREETALRAVAGALPVPEVLGSAPGELRLARLPGRHGQDLLDDGRAAAVLAAAGRTLRALQAIDVRRVLPGHQAGTRDVLVHGDYGPNNLLLAGDPLVVTAVLDWEWARPGAPVEDLAWCEWIVRMHHPRCVSALDALFEAYGARPPWHQRQTAMLARCRELIDFTRQWDPAGPGVAEWQRRVAITEDWPE